MLNICSDIAVTMALKVRYQREPEPADGYTQGPALVNGNDKPLMFLELESNWALDKRQLAPSIFSSAMLHVAVTVFLLNVPLGLFLMKIFPDWSTTNASAPRKVYELRMLTNDLTFPVMDPDGPGGQPGVGEKKPNPPARGATQTHPHMKLVSNFPEPDNFRQTILQPASPPDVKIPVHLELPNVILGSGGQKSLPSLAQPAIRPVLQVKSETLRSRQPKIVEVAVDTPAVANPSLPVASSQLPTLAQQATSAGTSAQQVSGGGAILPGNDSRQLVALGVDPAPPTSSVEIVGGQRYGNFSIAAAVGPGSPGGVKNGVVGGGRSGGGTGGDASVGVGSGVTGGGGTQPSAGAAPVSTSTDANVPHGLSGILPSELNALIFPVPRQPRRYREGFVVTAGAHGGGGLHIYGVLQGGKVYTAYLPMPGRSWILQYAARDSSQARNLQNVKVQIDAPVAPPAAEEMFDFRRGSRATADDENDLIVLRGIIGADGSINKLAIQQGADQVTNQVALATFQKWKFKPATKAGKAIEVEILVGIPSISIVSK
jgi:hypothetical protein